MATDPIVILSTARTPMGSMQGSLADASATDLGATAVRAAVDQGRSVATGSRRGSTATRRAAPRRQSGWRP